MLSYPYFWKILQRTNIQDSAALVLLLNVLSPTIASLAQFRKKKYFRRLLYMSMQRSLRMLLLSAIYAAACHNEIIRRRSTNIYPLDPDWRSKPPLRFFSPCWQCQEADTTFDFRFRFRRDDFHHFMNAMGFCDAPNSFIRISSRVSQGLPSLVAPSVAATQRQTL